MSKKTKKYVSDGEELLCHIKDQSGKRKDLSATIVNFPSGVGIMVQGYGDNCSNKDEGCPVLIENIGGQLRVIVWGNINQEDPTNIISLDRAREKNRKTQ